MTVEKIKKQKAQKRFENYKHCLEETQHDNKVNYLEKMKLT